MTDAPQFRVVLRGYEPAQVDQSVQQLAKQADEARAQAAQLAERVRVLEQESREAADASSAEAGPASYEHLAAARAEADELRTKARLVLEDARNESAVLTKRRDEIAAELEGLSGVIQALAVPTDGPTDGPAESAPKEKETHP